MILTIMRAIHTRYTYGHSHAQQRSPLAIYGAGIDRVLFATAFLISAYDDARHIQAYYLKFHARRNESFADWLYTR